MKQYTEAYARLAADSSFVAKVLSAGVRKLPQGVPTAQRAMAGLEGVAGADRERAGLRTAMSAAYMLDRRLDEAIDHGERGRAESLRLGDDEAALHSAATLGSVLVFAGRLNEGWTLLEEAITQARDTHQEAEAARGYRMISTSASVLVEYDHAERWLVEGLRYAQNVELWNHRHYMTAHLAHVQWATGHWDAATATAQQALADGRGGVTTRITAQYVLGYLALGRGDLTGAAELLQEALTLGERMAELQRFSPPLWGLAEVARCQDQHAEAIALCERGFRASAGGKDAAYLFPYLVTGVRAQLAGGDPEGAQSWAGKVGEVLAIRALPGTQPAQEHAAGLIRLAHGDLPGARQSLTAAVQGLSQQRRFWEGAWARLDLAAVALKSRRRGEAVQLIGAVRTEAAGVGARPLVEAADRMIAPDGNRSGRTTRWHPLSAREFEVAQLVAEGLTNRQIAERLTLAPKTISAHVEHILTKLGAARRAEIASWYTQVGPDKG
jgi:DNA-binding CsgD family transcriptional regulator/tetratricopeptide (TPR) repeat protein